MAGSDGQAAAPVGFGQFERVREHVDAGVVDDDVDAPEARQRACDQCVDGGAVGHVGQHEQVSRVCVLDPELGAHGGGMRVVAVCVDDHVCTFGREPARDGRADAHRRSGHDRDLAL
jgi:hypothetical protein